MVAPPTLGRMNFRGPRSSSREIERKESVEGEEEKEKKKVAK